MTATFIVSELAFQNGDVLAALDQSPNGLIATTAELARLLGRDKSNLTKTLAKLTAAGILADPPLSGLTPEGQAQMAAWRRAHDPDAGGDLTARADQLRPNPDQPRKHFDEEDMAWLTDSIADKGVLLPLLVRPADDTETFVIIAGERRFRAVGSLIAAGRWAMDTGIPIRIASAEDEAGEMELALIENTQRSDLNHMELAQGYQRLADLGRTPKQIAAVVGRTNDHVTQHLRLTRLAPDDQAAVAAGDLPLHQALDKLRAANTPLSLDGRGAGGEGEAPAPTWTTHDIHRTPFAARDGDTDAMLTIWIMTDGDGLYRFETRASLGHAILTDSGGHCDDPATATAHAIAHLHQLDLPRPAIEWLDRLLGPYVVNGTDRFNATRAQEARYALGWDHRPSNSGGGKKSALVPPAGTTNAVLIDEADGQSSPHPTLSPRAHLALIELAHKIAVERRALNPAVDLAWSGDPRADHAAFGASVGQFWLDGAHGELTSAHLAGFTHVRGGRPPIASLTPAGVAFLLDTDILPVGEGTLGRARSASGLNIEHGFRYQTPWLEQVAEPHADTTASADTPNSAAQVAGDRVSGDSAPHHEDPWHRTPDQIAEDDRLDAQVALLALGDPLVDVATLFADFGVAAAETRDGSDDDIGLVFLLSGDGATVTTLTVDQNGDLPTGRARAIADLVAHQLTTVLGGDPT